MKKSILYGIAAVIGIIAAFIFNKSQVNETPKVVATYTAHEDNIEVNIENNGFSQQGKGKQTNNTQPAPLTADFKRTKKFEDDWCSVTEIVLEDYEYMLAKQDEWILATGNLQFMSHRPPEYLDSKRNKESIALIQAYSKMTNEELLTSANAEDDIAKIALLSRYSVPKKQRTKFARELLIQGKTGTALTHLVINETVLVASALERGEKLEQKHTRQLRRALTYVNYGLARADVSGLQAFLIALTHGNDELSLSELFNSKINKGAQLIFTTHDTNLLSSDLLRRDQIEFVEKIL
jgi:hypothetical protein